MKTYQNDAEFKKLLAEEIERGGVMVGRATQGGRSFPCSINELRPNGNGFFVLSNDSRYAGDSGAKGRNGFSYSFFVGWGDSGWVFEFDFKSTLKMEENAKFIAIGKNGQVGSFESLEKIKEYLSENPKAEVRFFEVTNELKPKIEVKFG